MAWNTTGVQTDPTSGTILADTGVVLAGLLDITLIAWDDTGDGELELAVRNTTNTADVATQRFTLGGIRDSLRFPVTLLLNQRVVARMRTDLTGHIQASLLT